MAVHSRESLVPVGVKIPLILLSLMTICASVKSTELVVRNVSQRSGLRGLSVSSKFLYSLNVSPHAPICNSSDVFDMNIPKTPTRSSTTKRSLINLKKSSIHSVKTRVLHKDDLIPEGYVTPSESDVEENDKRYSDPYRFLHQINMPERKFARTHLSNERDIQRLWQKNSDLHSDLEDLEMKLRQRIEKIETQFKEQNESSCKVLCNGESPPLLDVIDVGKKKHLISRGLRACPDNCSGNGRCVRGLCRCRRGYSGLDCSEELCSNGCSGHGSCSKHGKCKCWGKRTGKDCSELRCANNCSGNGDCQRGRCVCNEGFTGKDCFSALCPNACSGKGRCDSQSGTCDCDVAWEGDDCSQTRCALDCSNRGLCVKGRCKCEEQWEGKACEKVRCPMNCSSHGRCRNGTCLCAQGWTGLNCGSRSCPGDCSGFGDCHNGSCECYEGWTGRDCTVVHCPDMCSNNGRCVEGMCVCNDGWEGVNCADVRRPSNLKITKVQPNTIDVSWKKTSSKLTRNQVNCIPMSGTANAVYQSVGPNVTKVTIRDLDSGTQYTVFVHAVIGDALSAPLSASIKTAVDSPSSLSWLRIGDTFAEMSWTPPEAKIDRYKIVCSCKEGGAEFNVLPNKTSVVIRDLYPGDSYTIALFAIQDDDISSPIRINFTTALDTPEEMDFLNVTATSALVRWSESMAKVDGYLITFIEAKSYHPDLVAKQVTSSTNELTLSGLQPNKMYNVTLYAVRGTMRSLPLKSTLVAGIDPPINLRITKSQGDDVVVEWRSSNERIQQFRVTINSAVGHLNGDVPLVDNLLAEKINYTSFDSLNPGLEYIVQVYAVDGDRESGPLTKRFTTAIDPPVNITAVDVTPTSVTIRWTNSPANVDSYTAKCRNARTGIVHELLVASTDDHKASFRDLQPMTRYNVSVQAVLGAMSSDALSLAVLTALPTPRNLMASMPSYKDLVITWSLIPALSDPDMRGLYNVIVEEVSDDVKLEFLASADKNSFTVPNLKAGLTYNVTLTAQSNNPWIPSSPPSIIFYEAPVDPPSSVSVSCIGYDNATIYWSTPSAPITGYLVSFQDMDEISDRVILPLQSNITFVTINELIDNTQYVVNVTSVMTGRLSAARTALFVTDMILIEPPEFLRAIDIRDDAIAIEWMASISENVDAYLVTYLQQAVAEGDPINLTVDKDSNSATLKHLQPCTIYEIDVFAQYQEKYSKSSHLVVQTTVDAPSELVIAAVSDRSFTMHWRAPIAYVKEYIVFYHRSDFRDERVDMKLPTTETACSIHGLQPATSYTVSIRAIGNRTQSAPTVAMVTTLPGPVVRLHSPKQDATSITLMWKVVESGEISGYKVTYHPLEDALNTKHVGLPPNETKHILCDLLPATVYSITVQSERSTDLGKGKTIVQATMLPPVRSLSAHAVDSQSVTVRWRAPQGVKVDRYEVRYRSLDEMDGYRKLEVTGTTHAAELTEMSADTQYSVLVKPIKQELKGKARQVKATTGSVLEAPEDLRVFNIREASAQVRWEVVTDKTVTGYLLRYKPIGSDIAVEKLIIGRKRVSYLLLDLQPGRLYHVALATERRGRVSYPPVYQRFVTAQILTPPIDVQVYDVTERSIGLEWNSLAADSVEEYHVTYAANRVEKSKIVEAGDKNIRMLLNNLFPGRLYHITLRSFRWGLDSKDAYEVNVSTLHPLLAPTRLSVTHKNQTNVSISWTKSTPDADSYDVITTREDNHMVVVTMTVDSTAAVIAGLNPGTVYAISVMARRGHKTSDATAIQVETDSRLEPPSNIAINSTGETSAMLRWKMTEQECTHVRVTYEAEDGLDGNTRLVGESQTSLLITNLLPGTLYRIQLVSLRQQQSSLPVWFNFTTDFTVPAPTSISFANVAETKMTVRWEIKSHRVRHFRISCLSETGDTRTITISRSKSEFPVKSLRPGTAYNVSVTALNGVRESRPIFGQVTTLLGGIEELSVGERRSQSVELTWRPLRAVAVQYEVKYFPVNSPKDVQRRLLDSGAAHNANITDLQPGTAYCVVIEARKDAQRSVSLPKIVETELDPPRKIKTSVIGWRSANLTWEKAFASDVTGYYVVVMSSLRKKVELSLFNSSDISPRHYNLSSAARHLWLRRLRPTTSYIIHVSTLRGPSVSKPAIARFTTGAIPFQRPTDCAEVLMNGERMNGIYEITVNRDETMEVFCDLTAAGGGWLVVQRRMDGSVDFNRSLEEYVHGFGDMNGEFWIGLKNLHRFTLQPMELRIDLRYNGESKYAIYSNFTVSDEVSGYVINGSTFGGDAGDSLSYHFGMKFTTRDRDNDEAIERNCAVVHDGAWWFKNCHRSNLNGQYANTKHSQGINWFTWGGFTQSMDAVEMKIRTASFQKLRAESRKLSERRNFNF